MGARALRVTLVLALALVALLFPRSSSAHAIGLSSGEYRADGKTVQVKLTFARGEILGVAPEIDADRDRVIMPHEVAAGREILEKKILGRLVVTGDAAPCSAAVRDTALTEQDGILVEGTFTCAAEPHRFEIAFPLFDDLPRGHRHVARAIGRETVDDVVFAGHARFSMEPAAAEASGVDTRGGASTSGAKPKVGAPGFVWMGVEHILTGYDHLVFLLGLVLVRGRLRSVLAVVTAFTVAHSITLALSTLNVWTPRPSLVEPAIALSIAYVGIENFFVKSVAGRWRITFPFGLIHGFGFAGALLEIDLPRERIPTALLGFNVGVELGQLAVLAVVLPAIHMVRTRTTWFEKRGVRVASFAVAAMGAVWFVMRVAAG